MSMSSPCVAHHENPAQLQLGRQLWPLCDLSNHKHHPSFVAEVRADACAAPRAFALTRAPRAKGVAGSEAVLTCLGHAQLAPEHRRQYGSGYPTH